MKKRIVITGMGVLSSIGRGKEEYWRALKEGRCGIRAITVFNTDEYKIKEACEVPNFDPQRHFTKREVVNFNRATALLILTTKQTLEDASISVKDVNIKDFGVSIGTTFGSLHSLSEFDRESVIKGPQLVNPALFPNTVANFPASQVSIYFKIKGFNTTISTGMCAGLDAIDCSIKAINDHDRRAVITGALEEMCEETFLGFYKLKYLSGMNGNGGVLSCPFDRRRNGIVFGEGAGVMVLEDLKSARARGANIYAEICGFASSFDPFRLNRYNLKGSGMTESMDLALQKAGLEPKDVDYICVSANSTTDGDLAEARAIRKVFGSLSKNIPVSSVKSMVGETYSAGGALSTIAAVGAIYNHFIPPTINIKSIDPEIDLNLVINKAKTANIKTVMVNAFGQNGACSSLIIKRFKE